MNYELPTNIIEIFDDTTDPAEVLHAAIAVIAGIHHSLYVESDTPFSIESDDYLLDGWDAIVDAAHDRLEELVDFVDVVPEEDRHPMDADAQAILFDGDVVVGIRHAIHSVQRSISALMAREDDFFTQSDDVSLCIAYFDQVRETLYQAGQIRTAQARLGIVQEDVLRLKAESNPLVTLVSGYVDTCTEYTNAMIGQPGFTATDSFRQDCVAVNNDIVLLDQQLSTALSDLAVIEGSLGGEDTVDLLEQAYAINTDSITAANDIKELEEEARDIKDECIQAAVDGYLATEVFDFALSERIRITANSPGPVDIQVGYTVDNDVAAEMTEITFVDGLIEVRFRSSFPPFIRTVVEDLNSALGYLITAVNLDESETDGLIRAGLSFIPRPLQNLTL